MVPDAKMAAMDRTIHLDLDSCVICCSVWLFSTVDICRCLSSDEIKGE